MDSPLAQPAAQGERHIRWMLLAAALVAACITAFVVFNTRDMTRAQQDSWRLTMQTQLDGVAQQAGRWLQEREEGAKAAAAFEPLVQLYGRLRSVKTWDASEDFTQWRADVKSLLAPTLNRNGIIGYVMTTRGGQVLADSSYLAGQFLDSDQEQELLRQSLLGPRYAHTTLPFDWPRRQAFNMSGPVILVSAAIWPRGPELEPGVLLLVIDPRTHFDELFKRGRIGLSGETYAVSAQGAMVTPSRFSAAPTAPGTRAAQAVTQGQSGEDLEGYSDYRGVQVVGLWRWDAQHQMGVITEVDKAEAYASVHAIRRQSAFTIVSTLFLIGSLLAGFIWSSRRMAATQAALRAQHAQVNQLALASQRAERAIGEREAQLRMLLDHFPGYMSITDKRNRYVFINRQLADIIGWEPEAVIGRHFSEVLDETTAAELVDAFSRPPGTHMKSDHRLLTKTGRRIRHLERHRIVGPAYADGEGINFSFGFDITHAKRGQELEAYRSRAMEMITTGQQLADILLQLVRDLESMLVMSTCSIQLLSDDGTHFSDHISSKDGDGLEQLIVGLQPALDKGTFGATAVTGLRHIAAPAQGHPTWEGLPGAAAQAQVGASWSEPIQGEEGQVLGVLTVCHGEAVQPDNLDLYLMAQLARLASVAVARDRASTRLQARDKALDEQRWQLQMTIDNMQDGFARGRMDDTVDMVNHALVQMLGYESAADLLGQPSKEMYTRLEDWQSLVSALLSQGHVRAFRCQARHRDGHPIWVEVSAHLARNMAGKPIGIEATIRDVSQQTAFEETLQKAREAAESAAEARGRFLANMSHEIRTPMNAIIGLTDLALRTELTPRQQDYLTKVSHSARSLLGLLNDILDFSKIESGRLDMENIPFNLDDVLGQLASVMVVQMEEKGLELLYARQPDLPVHLCGDPLRLGQVLTNLTNNARKFTEKGDIVLSVYTAEQQQDRVRLRFSVQDSGIGMTPAQMTRLFQPFSQGDESTTRQFGGTGLGLAIARQLVELMKGRIWVESAPGLGSNFQFEVELGLAQPPAKGLATDGAAAVDDPPKGLQGLRVLVVDDNAHAQEILRTHLEHLGCWVEVCDSAQACLERLKGTDPAQPIRLVIMDYRMPGMDGLTAARHIRQASGLPHVPRIILVTAAGRLAAEELEGLQHVDEMLSKPVNATVLKKVVQGVMGMLDSSQSVRARPRASSALPLDEQAMQRIGGARVLLVEDNAINQQVATELLEQAGLIVELAHNGQEALDRLAQASYDVVLMDLQMPVMDGYTAAARIRANPQWQDLPLLAMTANAMTEDRARVKAVGMNAHIAKPVVPAELFKTLLRWVKPGDRVPRPAPSLSPPPHAPTATEADLPASLEGVNLPLALTRIGGSPPLLRKLLVDFVQDHGQDLERLNASLDAGDTATAQRIAHTLKGVAGTLGATDLQQAATALERALRGSPTSCTEALQGLQSAMTTVMQGLAAWTSDLRLEKPAMGHNASPAQSSHPNSAQLKQWQNWARRLDGMLNEFDPEAAEVAHSMAMLLGPEDHEAQELARLAAMFDFDAAGLMLKRLRARWTAQEDQPAANA